MPVSGLAGRLDLALDRLQLAQREAARRAGVTHAALNRALQEDSDPSAELVGKVADALGLSLEWLFRNQGPMLREAPDGAAIREGRADALRAIAALALEQAAREEAAARLDAAVQEGPQGPVLLERVNDVLERYLESPAAKEPAGEEVPPAPDAAMIARFRQLVMAVGWGDPGAPLPSGPPAAGRRGDSRSAGGT